MNNGFLLSKKDTLIIIFIFVVFSAVLYVFYTEIIKNNKIKNSKNNLYIVKNELLKEVNQCKKNLTKYKEPIVRAILVNSGNANAFTGKLGEETVLKISKYNNI